MEQLKKRILEISQKKKLSHISSCLSVLPILQSTLSTQQPEDLVILDNAHAHLAHLVVKEELAKEPYELGMGAKFDAEELVEKYGIHCDREAGCSASGGSLGHGLGISIGFALANRDRQVSCIVSDGSLMEGSNWEALRIASELHLPNLKIHANLNGHTAVADIDVNKLGSRLKAFYPGINIHLTENGEGFEGVQGHYKVI